MNGKYVTTLLNVFAVFALFVGVTGIFGLFSPKTIPLEDAIKMIFVGLFAYATLSALVVIILNLVQMRKNTETPAEVTGSKGK